MGIVSPETKKQMWETTERLSFLAYIYLTWNRNVHDDIVRRVPNIGSAKAE